MPAPCCGGPASIVVDTMPRIKWSTACDDIRFLGRVEIQQFSMFWSIGSDMILSHQYLSISILIDLWYSRSTSVGATLITAVFLDYPNNGNPRLPPFSKDLKVTCFTWLKCVEWDATTTNGVLTAVAELLLSEVYWYSGRWYCCRAIPWSSLWQVRINRKNCVWSQLQATTRVRGQEKRPKKQKTILHRNKWHGAPHLTTETKGKLFYTKYSTIDINNWL